MRAIYAVAKYGARRSKPHLVAAERRFDRSGLAVIRCLVRMTSAQHLNAAQASATGGRTLEVFRTRRASNHAGSIQAGHADQSGDVLEIGSGISNLSAHRRQRDERRVIRP